ncbi:cellulose binding domain-containing protein [Acrocarpospora catenulata]|uniref:cellulose binding domain-containing protein n=1 Tax=Acrocarpospora catenulata TaxID=2836182 RepID=UPI001BDA7564|nr:cellulose binding domain-containing protein [Acrocarpospora catenulata]
MSKLSRVAAALLFLPLFALAGPPQANAATMAYGCHVNYDVTDWGTGFVVNVTIQNTGTLTFSPWILQFVFPGNETLVNSWSAVWSQTPPSVQAMNPTWYPSIAPGTTSVGIGFTATYSGPYTNPGSFTVNGVPCTVTFL